MKSYSTVSAYSEGVAMFLERLGADDTGEGLEKGLAEKQQFTNSIISKLLELIEQSRQIWRANGELFCSADCDLEEIVKEENGQMRQEIERLQNKFLEITEKERNASLKVSSFEDTLRMRENKIRDLQDQVSRLVSGQISIFNILSPFWLLIVGQYCVWGVWFEFVET